MPSYSVTERLHAAIKDLEKMPKVDIKGKPYSTVASRVEVFRKHFADWSIITTPFHIEDNFVRVKCEISDETGRVLASDMAEENRTQGPINRSSALENCTTSAIGRTLANLGLHGGEYASANEVDNAVEIQKEEKKKDKKNEESLVKSNLKAAAHDICRQIMACEDLDQLEGYWNSKDVKAFRKNSKTHYPEGLSAAVDQAKDRKEQLEKETEEEQY